MKKLLPLILATILLLSLAACQEAENDTIPEVSPTTAQLYTERADSEDGGYDIREYDADGNLLRKTWHNTYGIVWQTEEYDTAGRLLCRTRHNAYGTVNLYWSYKYDADSNLQRVTWHDIDGTVDQIDEYDTDGNLLHSTTYNEDGTINAFNEYGEDGNLQRRTVYISDTAYSVTEY